MKVFNIFLTFEEKDCKRYTLMQYEYSTKTDYILRNWSKSKTIFVEKSLSDIMEYCNKNKDIILINRNHWETKLTSETIIKKEKTKMTEEMKSKYEELVKTQELIKKLTAEEKKLKDEIIKYHGENDLICEDGYQSKISHEVRKTIQTNLVEEKFNIKIDDSCYKITPYVKLHVKKMIVEG